MLHNKFKKIGISISVIAFAGILSLALHGINEYLSSREGLSLAIVVFFVLALIGGLLVAIFSKEKIEDERVEQYRLQAFRFALIIGVFLATSLFVTDVILHKEKLMPAIGIVIGQMIAYLIKFHKNIKTDNIN